MDIDRRFITQRRPINNIIQYLTSPRSPTELHKTSDKIASAHCAVARGLFILINDLN